jgi:hypothetical protein
LVGEPALAYVSATSVAQVAGGVVSPAVTAKVLIACDEPLALVAVSVTVYVTSAA